MSWTKGDLIQDALGEIGVSEYVFDLQPEQRNEALRRLDAMMAMWNGKGIRLAYPIPATASGSSTTDDSGLPDYAYDAVIANLAIRIAPSYGKVVMRETKMTAKQAYRTLLARKDLPAEMQFPNTLPLGAGNRTTETRNYANTPTDPLQAGEGDVLTLE